MSELNGHTIDPENPPTVPADVRVPVVPVNGIMQVTISDDKAMADIWLFGPTGKIVIRVPTKCMTDVMKGFAKATQGMIAAGCDVGQPKRQTVIHKKPSLIVP